VLARLHSLELAVDEPDLYPAPHATEPGEWSRLRAAAIGAHAPWAIHLAAVDPLLGRIARLAEADGARRAEAVMTHGDVDTKNIVLSPGGGPHLCDWDVAGPWRPAGELADVALSLGGWSDFGISRTVLAASSSAGGRLPRFGPEDLGFSLTKSLDWLVFNVERAIGLRPSRPEGAGMASDLIPGLVQGLIRSLEVAVDLGELLRP
jgi:aminoglycoside phosphotransferase (APT) family kinase protein